MRNLILLAALGLFLASVHEPLAQDANATELSEVEPNNNGEAENLLRVAPGVLLRGEISDAEDFDWFIFESAEDGVFEIEVSATSGQQVSFAMTSIYPRAGNTSAKNGYRKLGLRVPKGLHSFCISSYYFENAGGYTVRFTKLNPAANEETEPNDEPENALPLVPGQSRIDVRSNPENDTDCYAFDVAQAGTFKLSLAIQPGGTEPLRLLAALARGNVETFHYRCDLPLRDYVFYPVLDADRHVLTLQWAEGQLGDGCTLLVEPVTPRLSADDEKRARAAIEKGVAFIDGTVSKRGTFAQSVAAEGASLAALCGEPDFAKRKAALERDYVKYMTGYLENGEQATYKGEQTWRLMSIYDHCLAAIALADAAEKGSEAARKLCEQCVKFILATQLSSRRDASAGGPVDSKNECYGGWRYNPGGADADLSITGWCLIAIIAADSAGIKLEGMRDSVRDARKFIEACYDTEKGHFKYMPAESDPGNIRNSIGALTLMLLGADQDEGNVARALEDLDRHFPSGTQVDVGPDDCFYYWYYATRVNYLRGGKAWENWRALMVDQLLRRQQADGSWDTMREAEASAGPRYSTGLAVVILRLCLNEAPKYLRPEARGF